MENMCPLRYIILAVSAVVALLLLMYGQTEEKDPLAIEASGEGEESESKEGEEERKPTRPVDFITGRYLYNAWRDYRDRQAASAKRLEEK